MSGLAIVIVMLLFGAGCFCLGTLFQEQRESRPREIFPAPRDEDCRYGCCHVGDKGLWSEAVPAASSEERP